MIMCFFSTITSSKKEKKDNVKSREKLCGQSGEPPLKKEVNATQTETAAKRAVALIIPLCVSDNGSNTYRTEASIK